MIAFVEVHWFEAGQCVERLGRIITAPICSEKADAN